MSDNEVIVACVPVGSHAVFAADRDVANTDGLRYKSFYAQKPLHREVFTQQIFTHRNLYAERFYTISFYREELLHREIFTQKNFDTQTDAFTQGIHLCRSVFTHTKF